MTSTPGPWSVHHGDELQRSDGVICETGNGWEVRPAIGTLLGDEQADLKLIAMAPELAEALQDLTRASYWVVNGELAALPLPLAAYKQINDLAKFMHAAVAVLTKATT